MQGFPWVVPLARNRSRTQDCIQVPGITGTIKEYVQRRVPETRVPIQRFEGARQMLRSVECKHGHRSGLTIHRLAHADASPFMPAHIRIPAPAHAPRGTPRLGRLQVSETRLQVSFAADRTEFRKYSRATAAAADRVRAACRHSDSVIGASNHARCRSIALRVVQGFGCSSDRHQTGGCNQSVLPDGTAVYSSRVRIATMLAPSARPHRPRIIGRLKCIRTRR